MRKAAKKRKGADPEYPLSEKRASKLKTPSGIPFREMTLEAVLDGSIRMEDLRVTSEALEGQAKIAERCRRRQLAENFRRAAELVNVPEDRILETYNALRPGRSDSAGLAALADDLESNFHARRCAQLIREAAEAYARRAAPDG
jgi:propanediol dehydratase small subunit